METAIVSSDALAPSESELRTIRLSPGQKEICIQSKASTDIPHVGEQLWRGSLLLGSYLTEHSKAIEGKTLIEIGCGTGFLSILACQLGAHAIATDYLEEILDLARANAARNGITDQHIRFEKLDLLDEEAIAGLCAMAPSIDLMIASDMIYDEVLTESFCHVVASSLRSFDCYCLLSGEHRFNFLASSLSTEFDVFRQFVCFNEACWKAYSRECSSRSSSRRKCDCGCLLLAKLIMEQQNSYILLLSSVY